MSRKTKLTGLLVTLALLVASLAAGAAARSDGSAQAKKLRIGLVLPDLSNLYIAGLRNGVQAQARKGGHTVLVKGTSDPAGQSNAALAYIAAKVDVLIIDSIDGKGIIPAIKRANAAKIPVITIQSDVFGGERAAFIAGREDLAGLYMGMAASDFCLGVNPCKIGIIEGIRADQSGAEENRAFREHVKKFPNIKIVGASETQYDPAKALNLATNLLTAHPGIDYLYAWWDPGGAAAVQAIKAKGKLKKIGVASQNGDCIQLGHVLKGDATVTAAFFPSIIGGGGVTSAIDAIKGKKLPKWSQAPVIGITTKLANDWLTGKGSPPPALKADLVKRLKDAKAGNCS